MSATAFGGIRGGAQGGRFGGGGSVTAQLAAGAPGGSVGVAGPPAGSPYTAAPPMMRGAIPTHRALMILVALEVVALIALRGGFRHYHGG
jgi:hypothetical protein